MLFLIVVESWTKISSSLAERKEKKVENGRVLLDGLALVVLVGVS
jgi:hypothetical protein